MKTTRDYLAGALDSRSGQLWVVDGPHKTSTLFCPLLNKLIKVYPDAQVIHVILDNYGIHESRQVQNKLAALEGRIQRHFCPPQSRQPERAPVAGTACQRDCVSPRPRWSSAWMSGEMLTGVTIRYNRGDDDPLCGTLAKDQLLTL